MPQTRTLIDGPVSVVEYHCDAGPRDRGYWEAHSGWSVSFVERGTFSCHCRGHLHELVPGSVLLGRPGDEYRCTHEHRAGGDECLAVQRFRALGLAAGGRDNGAPGPRPDYSANYYAAFLLDPDGHNVEAVCFK